MPSPPFRAEREGPTAEPWAGEVGPSASALESPTSPRPSPPPGAERERAWRASAALVDRGVVALRRAGEELARPADLHVGVLDHLGPLRDPADGAGDREQYGEHRGREAHRLQDDPRIEIDIRVQLAADEVIVVERDLFQLHRQIEQRLVLDAELVEHLVAAVAQHAGAG